MLNTAAARRRHYRANVRAGFDILADLYYQYWGEFFHLALFDDQANRDFASAFERTHNRYFEAIRGTHSQRILELACGGGALSAWMARRTSGDVLGIDMSPRQLAHARKKHLAGHPNLRFMEIDIMRLGELPANHFDAAICLDAFCYLPDKRKALKTIATRLQPGARFLLVDWCRAARVTRLQHELILEPLCRTSGIPSLATIEAYGRDMERAGFAVLELSDLSDRIDKNWERGYRSALEALTQPARVGRLVRLAAAAAKYGPQVVKLAKEQFLAVVLLKVAADAGILRYGLALGERT